MASSKTKTALNKHIITFDDVGYQLADIDHLLSVDDPETNWNVELDDVERCLRHWRHERIIYLMLTLVFGGFSAATAMFLTSTNFGCPPFAGFLTAYLLVLIYCVYWYFLISAGVKALHKRGDAIAWRLRGRPDPSRAFYSKVPTDKTNERQGSQDS